ncbi:MAG: 30S ribosomal protein S24e [Candidatus Nanoarchaeia archaeon]|jgi:small subunit ribosomal protein S24e
MDVKLLNETENLLFNRNEIRFEVVHDGEPTPKLIDVRLLLAKKVGGDSSLVVIDGFKTLFGIGRTIGNARVYKNTDEMNDYESQYLLKRNNLIEAKKEGVVTESAEAEA